MNKIVRTPTKVTGGITPEEKLRLDEHANLWKGRILRTEKIIPEKIIPAIEGIYAAAGRKKPRVIIVPSPIVMAFAFGAASSIIHVNKNATKDATRDATYDATDAATYVRLNHTGTGVTR